MAVTQSTLRSRFAPLLEALARGIGRHAIARNDGDGTPKAIMRAGIERNVKRVVQVYWTPFQVEFEGDCLGIHLDVPSPRRHWTECYVSPTQRNWVMCFYERADGDVELAYYRDYESPNDAIDGFFNLSSWYTLTATDLAWDDVAYEIGPELQWHEAHEAMAGKATSAALQESLKKSTILWMRWRHDGREYTMPVWYLLDNKTGSIYVLSGERQQTLPGAATIREADVIFRQKGKNIQVAEVPASVRVLEPGSEWDEIAEKIAEKRLNIPGLPEETARRWRDECVILELRLRA
jgi:hypothetical protein